MGNMCYVDNVKEGLSKVPFESQTKSMRRSMLQDLLDQNILHSFVQGLR